jgi:hypothetical protein
MSTKPLPSNYNDLFVTVFKITMVEALIRGKRCKCGQEYPNERNFDAFILKKFPSSSLLEDVNRTN